MNGERKMLFNGGKIQENIDPKFWEDRSFLFGDGLYEVIRFYDKVARYPERHMDRLFMGLKEMEMDCETTREQFLMFLQQTIDEAPYDNGYIYLQVSRGSGPRWHVYTEQNYKCQWMMQAFEIPKSVGCPRRGSKHMVYEDFRWKKCHIKSVSLQAAVWIKSRGVRKGCEETILVRDGFVTECSTSNLFIVKNGILYTHPKNHLILGGVTRSLVIDYAASLDLLVIEEPFTLDALLEADEVFSTNSIFEVVPVTHLLLDEDLTNRQDEEKMIGQGEVGAITKQIQNCFYERLIHKNIND